MEETVTISDIIEMFAGATETERHCVDNLSALIEDLRERKKINGIEYLAIKVQLDGVDMANVITSHLATLFKDSITQKSLS